MQDNYFEAYNKYKDGVLEVLEETSDFYKKHGMEKQANTIQDNIDVIKSGEFEVVVVGEFSSGKSTFLNALMREKYLPSYTKETTATINYLRNSSESEYSGIAYFKDGHTEILSSLDYDVVAQYVSTKNKNMKVEENIKHLDLFIDSPFLENKVTLIDSPGLNGMKQGLGDITDAQIRKSHAVIFMFSAEQSGKRSEFEYLKKVKDQVDTVFLVLNKIDCIKESEHETVEEKIQDLIDSYKKVFPEDTTLPKIIPVAAYPALVARSKMNLDYPQNHFDVSDEEKIILEEKSRMADFEDKLLHFLTNSKKTVTQIGEPMQRLSSILGDTVSKYETEIAVLEKQNDGEKLQKQISTLKSALIELDNQLNEKRGEIRKTIKIVERDTLESLSSELEDVRRQGKSHIDELDNIDTLGDYFELLNNLIGRKLNDVVKKMDQTFKDNFFDAVQSQYTDIVNSLEEKLDETESESMSFDVKINVSANSINAGLENFNTMKDNLKKKMDELEEKKKNLAKDEDKLIEISCQSLNLKDKLERLERNEKELISSFCPPEVEITYKSSTKEVERKGVFHRVRDFVFGKNTVPYTEEIKDDSERKNYISKYNEQKKYFNDKQDELERKLDEMAGVDKRLEHTTAEREAIQAELENLRKEEKEMNINFNKELDEKYDKEIERIKKRAVIDMDNYIDEIEPQIRKMLNENRNVYVGIMQDLVEQSVTSQIEQKKEECDNLIKLKEEANDNKETLLAEKNDFKNQAVKLKEKTDDILKQIQNIKIDKVKYQAI